MIVKSVRTDSAGRVHVILDNKTGITFDSVGAVRAAAKEAIQRLGAEGRIAIALVRALQPKDIEGADLSVLLKEDTL